MQTSYPNMLVCAWASYWYRVPTLVRSETAYSLSTDWREMLRQANSGELARRVGGAGEGARGLRVIVGVRSWSLKLSILSGMGVVI